MWTLFGNHNETLFALALTFYRGQEVQSKQENNRYEQNKARRELLQKSKAARQDSTVESSSNGFLA